jgi:outer membrane protein with beta-barrel domain
MRLASALALILFLPDLAGSSPAQRARPAPRARPASRPRQGGPDLSASYSLLRAGEASLNGVDFSASFHYRRAWRLATDLSVHSGSFAGASLKQVDLMGGLRRVLHSGRQFQPFGQGLVGFAHSSSTVSGASLSSSQTGVGGALGLGADYRLSARWALRGQLDYLILHSSTGWDGDPRLSIGLAYRFRN